MFHNFKSFALVAASLVAVAANAGDHKAVNMVYGRSTVDDAKWGSASRYDGLSIADGALIFNNNNNFRSAYTFWGPEAWESVAAKDNGTDNYHVTFTFAVNPGGDVSKNDDGTYKQQNFGFVLASEQQGPAGADWACGFNPWTTNTPFELNASWAGVAEGKVSNWLFRMDEVVSSDDNASPVTEPVFTINSTEDKVTLTAGSFYVFDAMVDIVKRTVKYSIAAEDGADVKAEGTYAIPEGVEALPSGIFVGANRGSVSGNALFKIKNLIVGKYVEGEVLDAPTYKLAAVAGENRGYTFACAAGTEVHVTGINGASLADMDGNENSEIVITYDQVEAQENLVYVTTSGTVKAWTKKAGGDAVSSPIEFAVECGLVKLPTPVATIVAVSEGFSKTYQVTVDNSEVPTKPDLTFSYTFGDKSESDLASGSRIVLEGTGVLKIKAVKFGFEDSDVVTVVNNQFFEVKQDLDFEHMTLEGNLKELGFVALDPLQSTSTSGETNWTGRGRMYDFIVTNDGADTAKIYLPGCVDAIADNIINRWEWQIDGAAAKLNEIDSLQAMMFAPLMFSNKDKGYGKANTIQIKEGVGIVNNETAQNNVTYYIRGIEEEDYALVYIIDNYGGSSTHGYFASAEEAKAANHGSLARVIKGNGSFDLYRIQDAITRILILTENEEKRADVSDTKENAIKSVNALKIDNVIRDLSGRPVRYATKGQVYLKNGVMFVNK